MNIKFGVCFLLVALWGGDAIAGDEVHEPLQFQVTSKEQAQALGVPPEWSDVLIELNAFIRRTQKASNQILGVDGQGNPSAVADMAHFNLGTHLLFLAMAAIQVNLSSYPNNCLSPSEAKSYLKRLEKLERTARKKKKDKDIIPLTGKANLTDELKEKCR